MINILGVNISTNSKKEILEKISSFLNTKKSHYIATPNPEFLLSASKDEEFFYILNKADLTIPDGIGLSFAGIFMGRIIKRISGIDLMQDICELAAKENKSVFLLGGAEDAAEKASLKLAEKYPKLKIVGAQSGLKHNDWEIEGGLWKKGQDINKLLIDKINKAKPDIIFVAFGHVKQEKWIYHSLPFLPSVRLAMGVGGSFDFISGRIKRAPKLFRNSGIEWLWRLLQEPKKRLPRIFNAVIKFPLFFFSWFFIKPFFYRPNVACLLYKKDQNGKIKILLAERGEQRGHWQLPQGGTDGESLSEAGSRELREEIGTDKFKPIVSFKNLYYYKFGDSLGRAGAPSQKICGYKGQKQGLFIAEFIGVDSDITINYWDHAAWQWVDLDKVVPQVHTYRKKATEIFVEKLKKTLAN